MLIGVSLSDLGRRSRVLLAITGLLFLAALATTLFAPQSTLLQLRLWLLAILLLGGYWLSFLADLRGRLGKWQLALASAFGGLAWLLVVAVVLAWPQLLVFGSH